MAVRVSPTAHIDRGLELMRSLRTAQSGQAALKMAVQDHPTHDGFCLGCKTKVSGVLTEAVKPTKQKGVHRHHGPCPTCGASVSTFKGKGAT